MHASTLSIVVLVADYVQIPYNINFFIPPSPDISKTPFGFILHFRSAQCGTRSLDSVQTMNCRRTLKRCRVRRAARSRRLPRSTMLDNSEVDGDLETWRLGDYGRIRILRTVRCAMNVRTFNSPRPLRGCIS